MGCINEILSLIVKKKRLDRKKKRKEKERSIQEELKKLKERVHKLKGKSLEETESLKKNIKEMNEAIGKIRNEIGKERVNQNSLCKILRFLLREQEFFLSVIGEYREVLTEFESLFKYIEKEIDSKEKKLLKKKGAQYLHPEKCRKKKGNRSIKRIEGLFKTQQEIQTVYQEFFSLIPTNYRNKIIKKKTRERHVEFSLYPYKQTKSEEYFYKMLEENNKEFIQKEIERLEKKGFWRERSENGSWVELDEYQKKAVLLDPPQLLIKAGAGAGKTRVLLKKYEYLIKERKIPPKSIVLLAFQRKVVDEIKNKIQEKMDYLKAEEIQVSTFHAVGKLFWKDLQRAIKEEDIIRVIDKSVKNIVEELKKEDLSKIHLYKRALELILKEDKNDIDEVEISLRDTVRSRGEEIILEFLLEHDIKIKPERGKEKVVEWKYEARLPIREQISKEDKGEIRDITTGIRKSRNEYNQRLTLERILTPFTHQRRSGEQIQQGRKIISPSYLPDFTLETESTKIIWEHVGIDWEEEKGKKILTPKEYYKKYKEKKRYYKRSGIRVIETFYGSFKNKSKKDLKQLLRRIIKRNLTKAYTKKWGKVDVSIKKISEEEFKKRKEEYLREIKELLALMKKYGFVKGFIDFSRNMCLNNNEIRRRLSKDLKTSAITDLLIRIREEYEKVKKEKGIIDYADLIEDTIHKIDEDPKTVEHVEYILIDEFQDLNPQRYELLRRLVEKSDAKIIAIGDEYQAIMGFTGASYEYFVNFEKYFYGERKTEKNVLKECIKVESLKYNYRNPKEIIHYTNYHFKRDIKEGERKRGYLIVSLSPESALLDIEKEASKKKKKKTTVIILYRTYKDLEWLESRISQKTLFFKDLKDAISREIQEKKNPIKNSKNNASPTKKVETNFLEIYIATIHSMKGLEKDWVILPRVTEYGFPDYYKKRSDFLLSLVYDSSEKRENEEENLLYVALTRAREGVILLTEKKRESEVIKRIKEFKRKKKQLLS